MATRVGSTALFRGPRAEKGPAQAITINQVRFTLTLFHYCMKLEHNGFDIIIGLYFIQTRVTIHKSNHIYSTNTL